MTGSKEVHFTASSAYRITIDEHKQLLYHQNETVSIRFNHYVELAELAEDQRPHKHFYTC